MSFEPIYKSLGKLYPVEQLVRVTASPDPEELKAAYEHISKLEASLTEMVGIYWGEGDGHYPPPHCIQTALSLIGPEAL